MSFATVITLAWRWRVADTVERNRQLMLHPRVAIANYSGYIVGDDAMFESLLSIIQRACGPHTTIDALTAVPGQTRKQYAVGQTTHIYEYNTTAEDRRRAISIVSQADLLLIGGGDLIEGQSALAILVLLARMFGTPVGYVGVGVLVPESKRGRQRLRWSAKRTDFIVTRDTASAETLRELGVDRPREIQVLPDLAVGLERYAAESGTIRELVLEREGIALPCRFVAVNLRAPETTQYAATWGDAEYQMLADVCRKLVDEQGVDIVGVPLVRRATDPFQGAYGEGDDELLTSFAALVNRPGHVHVLREEYRPVEIVHILEQSEMAIGMRLHFLVLSASAGVPVIALSYAGKVRSFMQTIGQEHLCVEAGEMDAAQLAAAVATADAQQQEIRAQLAQWRKEALCQLAWFEKLVGTWTAHHAPLRRMRRLCLRPVALALLTGIHMSGGLRRRSR